MKLLQFCRTLKAHNFDSLIFFKIIKIGIIICAVVAIHAILITKVKNQKLQKRAPSLIPKPEDSVLTQADRSDNEKGF